MKTDFLYRGYIKPINILYDDETLEESAWWMSEEYSLFMGEIQNCSTEEFLHILISLFEQAQPNYFRLLGSFSDTLQHANNSLFSYSIRRNDVNAVMAIHEEEQFTLTRMDIEFKFDIAKHLNMTRDIHLVENFRHCISYLPNHKGSTITRIEYLKADNKLSVYV